jgi:hypothetical protein
MKSIDRNLTYIWSSLQVKNSATCFLEYFEGLGLVDFRSS